MEILLIPLLALIVAVAIIFITTLLLGCVAVEALESYQSQSEDISY